MCTSPKKGSVYSNEHQDCKILVCNHVIIFLFRYVCMYVCITIQLHLVHSSVYYLHENSRDVNFVDT
jgi:hypothetical protein